MSKKLNSAQDNNESCVQTECIKFGDAQAREQTALGFIALLFSQLFLSLTSRGWGGKATIALPIIVNATYKDISVTVRLQKSSISISQPSSGRHLSKK